MRLLFVIGTRPEVIKSFPVIEALRRCQGIQLMVCVTAQHRHLLDQAMDLVGLSADFDLHLMRPKTTLTELTCDALDALSDVIERTRPDCVLVQGDTTTTFAGALAAFYHKTPVAHIEAGLRTGSLLSPWPEEGNRRIVSTIADLHFAPTEQARENLIQENVPPSRIHVTGNTVVDALLEIRQRLENANYLSPSIAPIVTEAAKHERRIILITAHRRESWGHGIQRICTIAGRLAERDDVQIVVPVHPNPNVAGPIREKLADQERISLLEPLDYLSFVDLMRRSYLILTDSGGIQEEAPTFGIPVLVLRDRTERPEGVLAGVARLVGHDPDRVTAEAHRLLENATEYLSMKRAVNPYGDGAAALRIANIFENALRANRQSVCV